MKILVIDNYDSFVYNLVHYLEEFGCEVTVVRNDQFALEAVAAFDKILLSPGPGIPDEAGLLNPHSAICWQEAHSGCLLGTTGNWWSFGGTLINLEQVFHGVATKAKILVADEPLFRGFR